MGLIRKAASISTAGAVKYTSKREAQTKAALAQAQLADAETARVKAAARREARAGRSTLADLIRSLRSR